MISEAAYTEASQVIGCEIAAIHAVDSVESGGAGFLKPSGKIKIKFEGHQFRKYTKGRYDASHPHLSYKKWTEEFTRYGAEAYIRFNEAFRLDPVAAMLATSWGRFQIMGFNYSSCQFKTVDAFVAFLQENEGNHLIAFCRYVKAQGLGVYLVRKQWAAFALAYNGKDYKKNSYDLLLAHEYMLASARLKQQANSKPLIK